MLHTLFFIVIIALLCLTFVVSSALFILSVLGLFRTPHRSKLFFSYSHKDTELAQNIMKQLDKYRFRVWIDLGIEIPTDKLEEELSKALGDSEILIILASRNSRDSKWVQFELETAQKMQWRKPTQFRRKPIWFRDTIILSVDDWGSQVYEKIKGPSEDPLQELIRLEAAEVWSEFSPWFKRILWVLWGVSRKLINLEQSSITRIFKPTVTLFNLTGPSEPVMQQLTESLRNLTQPLHPHSVGIKVAQILVLLFFGFGMLSSGFLLLTFAIHAI